MFSQQEIDAVLADAVQAVESLDGDVGRLSDRPDASSSPSRRARPPRAAAGSRYSSQDLPSGAESVLKLCVPVSVRLAERRMLIGDVLKLVPGSIIEFDRTIEEELDLMVGQRRIGGGVAVKLNEHFGIRVSRVGNVEEGIASLGS